MASTFYAIRNFFRGPGSPPVEEGLQTGLPYSGSVSSGTTVTFDSAMQLSSVWAAVRIIAETIASLPFNLWDVDADGNKTVATSDLQQVLTQTPNQYQTSVEFWETMALNLTISGNAYAVKQRSGGRLVGLLPLSSSQVETSLLNDGQIIHTYTQGNDVKVYASDSVWHVKLFGNTTIGLSPLSYAANSIGIAQNADNRVNKIYSNGAKPSGVLTIDRTLTPDQRAQIKSNFSELEAGNEDRLFVLEAGMEYQQVSMSPQDIQLLDSRRFQIEDIGRFFGVPSILLNQTFGQSSLGSNSYEIIAAFYKLNLRPYLEKFESSIIRWLVDPTKRSSVEARFEFDALLRADTLSRMQANREAINSGQMTPNEARALEGRSSLLGGDTLLVQGAMIPIEKAGAEPEPPPMPPMPPEPEDDPEGDKSTKAHPGQQFDLKFEPKIYVSQPDVKVDNHINVEQPDIPVNVEIQNQEPVVHFEAVMPEQKMLPPIVNVEVKPSDITVVDNHPTRAIQTVERDDQDEITRTVIDYEK